MAESGNAYEYYVSGHGIYVIEYYSERILNMNENEAEIN
jgi:hypothetical protein